MIGLFKKSPPAKERKINLGDQLRVAYGKHRSGWHYALKSLKPLHRRRGVLFDAFIERTFYWHPWGVRPHKKPWIGVIHVPPYVPEWFFYEQSNQSIFKSEAWQESLPHCKGLFTLSLHHKKDLEEKLDVPVNNLFFATEAAHDKWEWKRFRDNPDKKIVQVGWWLRKLHTIFRLHIQGYRKVFLKATNDQRLENLLAKERETLTEADGFHDSMYHTVDKIDFLPDREYDRLLAENLVIIELYDTSANNIIAECMVRHTPILVNPLPAVIEYLGADYPLYFTDLKEASQKTQDHDLIHRAHRYLQSHPNLEKLSNDYFYNNFKESEIYRNL